MMMMMKVG